MKRCTHTTSLSQNPPTCGDSSQQQHLAHTQAQQFNRIQDCNECSCENETMTKDSEIPCEMLSLRDLMRFRGRPVVENVVWSLAQQSALALNRLDQLPAYISADTLFVSQNGEVNFTYIDQQDEVDPYFIAPETQEQTTISEKSCIYAVARTLEASINASLREANPPTLTERLRLFLVHMSQPNPGARPSLRDILQETSRYQCQTGILSQDILKIVFTEALQRMTLFTHENRNRRRLSMDCMPAVRPIISRVPRLPSSASSPNNTRAGAHPTMMMGRCGSVQGAVPQSQLQNFVRNNGSRRSFDSCVIRKGYPGQQRHKISKQLTWTRAVGPQGNLPSKNLGKAISNTSPTPEAMYNLVQDPSTGYYVLVPVSSSERDDPSSARLTADNRVLTLTSQSSSADGHSTASTSPNLPPNNFPTPWATSTPLAPGGQAGRNGTHGWVCTAPPQMPQQAGSSGVSQNGHLVQSTKPASRSSERQPLTPQQVSVLQLLRDAFAFDGYMENGEVEMEMAEFISTLGVLNFSAFTYLVSEHYNDLHWDKSLLQNLHSVLQGPKVEPRIDCTGPVPVTCKAFPEEKTLAAKTPRHHTWSEANFKRFLQRSKRPDLPSTPLAHEVHMLNSAGIVMGPVDSETQGHPGCGIQGWRESRVEHESNSCLSGHQTADDDEDASLSSWSDLTSRVSWENPGPETVLRPTSSPYSEGTSPSSAASPTSAGRSKSRCLSWSLSFHGTKSFGNDVKEYTDNLGQKEGQNYSLEAKQQELEQQITLEKRNLRKTQTFYSKLSEDGRKLRGTASERSLLSKLGAQMDEMKTKLLLLQSAHIYLELLMVNAYGLERHILPKLFPPQCPDSSLDEYGLVLQDNSLDESALDVVISGTPLGLMAYLYSRHAIVQGYLHHFIFVFRYFVTAEHLLAFISEQFYQAARVYTVNSSRVCQRTMDILHLWLDTCYTVDFTPGSELESRLRNFLQNTVIPYHETAGNHLMKHLCLADADNISLASQEDAEDSTADYSQPPDNLDSITLTAPSASLENSSETRGMIGCLGIFRRMSGGPLGNGKQGTTCDADEEFQPVNKSFASPHGSLYLGHYTAMQLAFQLTLMEEELLCTCHPVYFLDSRAQGINETSSNTLSRSSSLSNSRVGGCEATSLWVGYGRATNWLHSLLDHSIAVSTWVSAEILSCDSVKTQLAVLSKFLYIGKTCKELRNFATAMSILSALENFIVRQLPVWKNLPSKEMTIMDELSSLKVFLKSDMECLLKDNDVSRCRPTLPCVRIFCMHVQQLEIGSFTMANGMYKWPKLRTLARCVQQITLFQVNRHIIQPHENLQSLLCQRLRLFHNVDLQSIASEHPSNYHRLPTEKSSRKVQEMLAKVRATFQ
uniref:Uncharacterized protein n=1 Tax=Eptatretus burgeri TaxID=7764 RepID=A0A8C4WX84_EPTBU